MMSVGTTLAAALSGRAVSGEGTLLIVRWDYGFESPLGQLRLL